MVEETHVNEGFNSQTYLLLDGRFKQVLPYEAALSRIFFMRLASLLGVITPQILEFGVEGGQAYIISEAAAGEKLSDNINLCANNRVQQSYWTTLNQLHSFKTTRAGLRLEKELGDYVRERFASLGEEYPRELLDDDIVFAHRDLNPSNLFWDGNKLIVIDFGYAQFVPRHYDLAIHVNFAERYIFGDYRTAYAHAISESKLRIWRRFDAKKKINWARKGSDKLSHTILTQNTALLKSLGDT